MRMFIIPEAVLGAGSQPCWPCRNLTFLFHLLLPDTHSSPQLNPSYSASAHTHLSPTKNKTRPALHGSLFPLLAPSSCASANVSIDLHPGRPHSNPLQPGIQAPFP